MLILAQMLTYDLNFTTPLWFNDSHLLFIKVQKPGEAFKMCLLKNMPKLSSLLVDKIVIRDFATVFHPVWILLLILVCVFRIVFDSSGREHKAERSTCSNLLVHWHFHVYRWELGLTGANFQHLWSEFSAC